MNVGFPVERLLIRTIGSFVGQPEYTPNSCEFSLQLESEHNHFGHLEFRKSRSRCREPAHSVYGCTGIGCTWICRALAPREPREGVRDKRGSYGVREAQKSSNRPDRMQQRRAMMALAPRTDQRIPDCLRRSPITVRQPASTTPEPTKNFFSRYSA